MHWATLRPLLIESHVSGQQIHDARVAALCCQHGVREFWSADRDFSRFVGLNVINPYGVCGLELIRAAPNLFWHRLGGIATQRN